MRIKDFFCLCRLLPRKIRMYVRTQDGIFEVKSISKTTIDEWNSCPAVKYTVKGAVIELGDKYQRPSISEFSKG